MLSTAQMPTVKTALQAAYQTHGGVSALPWAQIIAIITSLLSGCIPSPTPAKVKEAVADDDSRDGATMVALRELYGWGAWRRHNGPAVSAALKEVVPATADDVLTAAID